MNQDKRVKGTRELVTDIFSEHPDWNASQIYTRYKILVGDTKKIVTLNSIQKYLEHLKPKLQEIKDSGLENPWQLGILVDHPEYHFDAEAIGAIYAVQLWARDGRPDPSDPFKEPVKPLTIRQALWIARLYALWPLEKRIKSKEIMSHAPILYSYAKMYSQYEVTSFLRGIPLDTLVLDNALLRGLTPIVVGDSVILFDTKKNVISMGIAGESIQVNGKTWKPYDKKGR